jgi:hypothetical protein
MVSDKPFDALFFGAPGSSKDRFAARKLPFPRQLVEDPSPAKTRLQASLDDLDVHGRSEEE